MEGNTLTLTWPALMYKGVAGGWWTLLPRLGDLVTALNHHSGRYLINIMLHPAGYLQLGKSKI